MRNWSKTLACVVICLATKQINAFGVCPLPHHHGKAVAPPSKTLSNCPYQHHYSDKKPKTTATTLFSSASSSRQQGAAVRPKRKSKTNKRGRNNKRSKQNTKQTSKFGEPLEQDDVADHVATEYISNMKLNESTRRRMVSSSENVASIDTSFLQSIKKLNGHHCLVLNANYMPLSWLPLSLWSWQDAVKGVFAGKVTVVDVYPDISVRAPSLEVPLPSVIALNEYVPQKNNHPAFNKRNVYLRDEYSCQYCNNKFLTQDLSLDHVVPRSKGGHLTWDNAVTCCNKCNCKKGSLLLHELRHVGMKLSRQPTAPTQYELAKKASQMLPKTVHPTWAPYIGLASSSQPSPKSFRNQKEEEEEEVYFDGTY